MGIVQSIQNVLYEIITRSRIVLYIVPLMFKFVKPDAKVKGNHTITDKSGKSFKVCKVNGKLYPAFGVERFKSIPDIRIRSNDVMLCGYPKTGCHWVHEILHMLVTGKAELTKHGKGLGGMIDSIPNLILDSLPSPRVLNSHLLFEDLPKGIRDKKIKIILTARNPKDTVVSFYNHVKNLDFFYHYTGEFNDFFDLFMEDEVEYGSYFDFYLKWDEVLKNPAQHPVLLLKFEDNKAQPIECVKKIAAFLELEISDEFAAEIAEKTNFSKMKTKRSGDTGGAIFRKGLSLLLLQYFVTNILLMIHQCVLVASIVCYCPPL